MEKLTVEQVAAIADMSVVDALNWLLDEMEKRGDTSYLSETGIAQTRAIIEREEDTVESVDHHIISLWKESVEDSRIYFSSTFDTLDYTTKMDLLSDTIGVLAKKQDDTRDAFFNSNNEAA